MFKFIIRNPEVLVAINWLCWIACVLLMVYWFSTGHWVLGIVAFVAAVLISKLTVSKTPPPKK